MTAPVVFAGPTLAGLAAPEGIDLRGPASAGDLYRAAREGARVIGLIDGVFEDRPAVWHKEILWALDRGVRVLGAASLGALRAAECAPFGMEGIGQVYAMCASGALEDDHAVAVAHAPAELGFAPLGEALVNVRATLAAAEALGVLDEADADRLRSLAETLHFKELAWPRLLAGLDDPAGARFRAWLPGGRVDMKRADGLLLLDAVRAVGDPRPATPSTPAFPETRYWREARDWFERGQGGLAPEDADVLDELRLDPARYEREMVRALARASTRNDARNDARDGARNDGEAEDLSTPDDLLEDLRGDLGLGSAASFRDWLALLRTDPQALVAALEDEERLMRAIERRAGELAPAVLDALRVEGRFEALDRRAADKRRGLSALRQPVYREAELLELVDELCARRRVAAAAEDLDLLARSLGLADRQALHRLLRRDRDYRRLFGEDAA